MKIAYEMETCGRCGGGGRYSFNLKDGDVCYGCSGRGERMSKRARKAHAAINAFKAEQFSKLVADVVVGDIVVPRPGEWYTVREIVAESGVSVKVGDQGFVKCMGLVSKRCTYSFLGTERVELRPTAEQFRTVLVPFARKFEGKGVTITDEPAPTPEQKERAAEIERARSAGRTARINGVRHLPQDWTPFPNDAELAAAWRGDK